VREHKDRFKKGQLVVFEPSKKDLQNFPFITCPYEGSGKFQLYETIDLDSFPSWNDFKNPKIKIERGEMGIILDKIGAPLGCALLEHERPDLDLSVYAVLMRGYKVQIFGIDLIPGRKSQK